ncbi:hypothetical protein CDL15_Pgr006980 [Punica granatum]|uniref:Uncharacterized protein n=1 Tax=Punica granatum TaxID=22663 RepID=A0A218X8C2_PUNGR|nr:hypothetical protein CDL15_Pgr006980 [Punica granatum]PKI45622.1 hypothetical protein CRG98_033938 [Punica granatum]
MWKYLLPLSLQLSSSSIILLRSAKGVDVCVADQRNAAEKKAEAASALGGSDATDQHTMRSKQQLETEERKNLQESRRRREETAENGKMENGKWKMGKWKMEDWAGPSKIGR